MPAGDSDADAWNSWHDAQALRSPESLETVMKRTITALFLLGSMCAGAQLFADDNAPSSGTSSNSGTVQTHKLMKQCMAKQRAANNGTSEEDMKKSCKDQIKAKIENPDDQSEPVAPAH
jgi:hypothetical protein